MKAYGLTDIGSKRNMNQDFIFVSEKPIGNLPNLCIVADGMGGHRAGDVASRNAVHTFVDSVKASEESNPFLILESAISSANEKIIELATSHEEYFGMGTTMVIMTTFDGMAYIANVGDSRLYLIQEDILQITRDHSMVAEMIARGEISQKDARLHEKKNIITRAIGGEPEVIADFFEIEVGEDDIILMCSDGLSNMVEDEVILKIVKEEDKLDCAVHKLVNTANIEGGTDNISVILAMPN